MFKILRVKMILYYQGGGLCGFPHIIPSYEKTYAITSRIVCQIPHFSKIATVFKVGTVFGRKVNNLNRDIVFANPDKEIILFAVFAFRLFRFVGMECKIKGLMKLSVS